MAYSDYGAKVFCCGVRRKDMEDAVAFPKCDDEWASDMHHGIMGNGNIKVICHKQGLPSIYEMIDNNIIRVEFNKDDLIDFFEYERVEFEYKGYKFIFMDNDTTGKCYYAQMIEPDETVWDCFYDYCYGEDFTD